MIMDLIDILVCGMKEEVEKGLENVDTCEFGQVADIVKDLAEAQYHLKVVEAMDHGESIPYVSNTMQKNMVHSDISHTSMT